MGSPESTVSDLERQAEYVSRRLSLVANPKRLVILCKLAEGEISVGELQKLLSLSQSALSQHLARLRLAGMVATRRDGQTIYYRLHDPETEKLMMLLYDAFCREPEERDG